jgi:hypothetical protein
VCAYSHSERVSLRLGQKGAVAHALWWQSLRLGTVTNSQERQARVADEVYVLSVIVVSQTHTVRLVNNTHILCRKYYLN